MRVLMADVQGDESDRIRASGLPRSTYQTARRRLLLAGLLFERYGPSPELVGARTVRTRLLLPYAEHRTRVLAAVRADPEVVVLWAAADSLLALSFSRSQADSDEIRTEWIRRSWTLDSDPGAEGCPVYFDYEGAWATLIGATNLLTYPLGLPSLPRSGSVSRKDLVDVLRRAVDEPRGPAGALARVFPRQSRREKRLLRSRALVRRYLPSIGELPPFRGIRPARVVFVTGRLRSAGGLDALLPRLSRECTVRPFLAVQDREHALLGMLAPAPLSESIPRAPVLPRVSETLSEIEVVREQLDGIFPLVNHRYDRLLAEEVG
jgi:hypothetical protein